MHPWTLCLTQNKHIKLAPTIIFQTLVLQVHVKCEHVPNTKQHTYTHRQPIIHIPQMQILPSGYHHV